MDCASGARAMEKTTVNRQLLKRCLGLSLLFHVFFLVVAGGRFFAQPEPMPSQTKPLRTQWHSGPRITLQKSPAVTPGLTPTRQPMERPNWERTPLPIDRVPRPAREVLVEPVGEHSVPIVDKALPEEPIPMATPPLDRKMPPLMPETPQWAVSRPQEIVPEPKSEMTHQTTWQLVDQDITQILPQPAIQDIPGSLPHGAVETVPTVSQSPATIAMAREIREGNPTAAGRESPVLAADPNPQPPSQPHPKEMRPKYSYNRGAAQERSVQPAVAALTHTHEHIIGDVQPLLSSDQGAGSRETAALSHIGTASGMALSGRFPSKGGITQLSGHSYGSERALAADSRRAGTMPSDLTHTDGLPQNKGADTAEVPEVRIPAEVPRSATIVAPQVAVEGLNTAPTRAESVPPAERIDAGMNPSQPHKAMVSEDVLAQVAKADLDRILSPAALPPLPHPARELETAGGVDLDNNPERAQLSPASLEVIRYVKPQYPQAALRQGKEGATRLWVRVNPDGVPQEVVIAESSGRWDLDNSALEAVKEWLFTPYSETTARDGTWVTVQIHFRLNDEKMP